MKNEILTIRVTPEKKEQIKLNAKNLHQNTSEYILDCVNQKEQLQNINESQQQFLNLFEVAFEKSNDPYYKKIMVLLNKINFNLSWLIKTQSLFMKQLKIPQTREDVLTSFIEHPISTIAFEETTKEFRNKSNDRSL